MNHRTDIQRTGHFDFKEFRCEKLGPTSFTTLKIEGKKIKSD
jgi:hypothetical protein